ncbi:nucleotidyltransferase domain-containing protein [Desulfovibrio falkowii]|uniref:Polymerase beta nucleotidyltransferase domain-containing protein n=1 Tax=Desulfovibrio falkowii TaxID=3136602 RepID=A0ABQ0E5G1_9BACT
MHPAANSLLITLPEAAAALSAMQGRLGRSLHAVYLHGSAVTGGLRPRSDVDLLAVVDQPIPPQARKTLVTDLLDISGRYPSDPYGRRPLELIVFLQPELAELPYPAPVSSSMANGCATAAKQATFPHPAETLS